MDIEHLNQVRQQAELIYSRAQVDAALAQMAQRITQDLAHTNPIILCVMTGALVPAGLLLPLLDFPLRLDYVHASRYRERTYGTDLQWKKSHEYDVSGQTVLLVDDILDEGLTLAALIQALKDKGAAQVRSAVLVEKQLDQPKPCQADYVGLLAPNRYLFGCGMDYQGYWRNADGIYALREPA